MNEVSVYECPSPCPSPCPKCWLCPSLKKSCVRVHTRQILVSLSWFRTSKVFLWWKNFHFFEKIIRIIFIIFWKNKNKKNYFYFFKKILKWENNFKLFFRFFEKIIWKNIIFSLFRSEKIIYFYFLGKIEKIIPNYFLPGIIFAHLWFDKAKDYMLLQFEYDITDDNPG